MRSKLFMLGLLLITGFANSKPLDEAKVAETDTMVKKAEPTVETETDDRINLNFNRGHAHAVGPYGSMSGSDAETYGIQGGIRGPGYDRPLFSQTGGRGSSYANGPFAPHTYAHGNTQLRPGYIGGNADAGFYGGHGETDASSLTQHIEIPLDAYGTVFYSNLKDKTKKKPNTVTKIATK